MNPIPRRNALLISGGVFLILAVASDPRIVLMLGSVAGLAAAAVVIASGFYGAKAVREFADVFLRTHEQPWYARPWASLFLSITLSITSMAFSIIGSVVFAAIGIAKVVHLKAMVLEFLGLVLLWICLMDWPTRSGMTHSWFRKTEPPVFRPFGKGSFPHKPSQPEKE